MKFRLNNLIATQQPQNQSSTPVEIVELSEDELDVIVGAGPATSGFTEDDDGILVNHNETILSSTEISQPTSNEIVELSEDDLDAIVGAGGSTVPVNRQD